MGTCDHRIAWLVARAAWPARAAAALIVGIALSGALGCSKASKPVAPSPPATTTASPGAGTYGSVQSVTLTADRPATIHYSLDGADPSPGAANTTSGASPVAGIPIPQGTTVLKFYSVTAQGATETLKSVTYVVDAAAPQISFTSSPTPFGVLTSEAIDWHCDKGGSYVVELGGSGTPGSGTALSSGVVVANAPMSQTLRGVQLSFAAARPVWVYVTDTYGHVGSASLSLVMKPLTTIPLAGWLRAIAFSPSGARAYVIVADLHRLLVLDTDPASGSYQQVLATIPLTYQPGGVAVTPDGTRAFIPLDGSATIAILATATNTITYSTLGQGGFSGGIAITPDGSRAYFPSPDYPDGQFRVLDTNPSSGTYLNVLAAIPFPLLTHGEVAITPDGSKAILNWGGIIAQATDVIDANPASATYNTVIASPGPVVGGLFGDVVVGGNAFAYALSGYGGLTKIDLAAGTVALSYAGPVLPQGALAITPDGLHLLTGYGGLRVVDTATMSDEGAIDVGGVIGLGRIAITPDGTRAYVEVNVQDTNSAIVCVPLR